MYLFFKFILFCYSHSFISSDGKYRAVLVDSEPKVIQKVVKGLSFRYMFYYVYIFKIQVQFSSGKHVHAMNTPINPAFT